MDNDFQTIDIAAKLPELVLYAKDMGMNPEDRETQQSYLTYISSNLYAMVRAIEEAAGFSPGLVNTTVGSSLLLGECVSGDKLRITRAVEAMKEMGNQLRSAADQAEMEVGATHEAPEGLN